MADIGPQRAPEPLPVNPLRPPEPAGSAHTSVLDPRAPPWMGMLPQAPPQSSMADMIAAQQAQLKMGEQRVKDQGRNALASLYADPANLDPNGALKPEAITKLGAAGFPDQALAVMGTQAEIGQRQQATRAAGQKFLSGEQERLVTQFEPLVGEYDDNVKKFGQARALQIGQEHYTAEREKAQAMGYSPAVVGNIPPNFDPERLRRTALGLKGAQDYEFSQAREKREQGADTRASVTNARGAEGETGNFKYKDDSGAVVTGFLIGNKDQPGIFTDSEGKVRRPIEKVGTHDVDLTPKYSVQVPDGKGGFREQDAAFVSSNPPGQRYVDPATSAPITEYRSVKQKTPSDVEDPDAERATAEQIARYQIRPYTGMSARSPRSVRVMKQVQEINPNYREGKFAAAVSTERDFASGVTSRRMDSINTAVQHVGMFKAAADALRNGSVPAMNAVLNYVQTELGHPEVTDFNTASGIVADETIKAVVGSGAVFDREGMQKNLSDKRSPEQFEGQQKIIYGLMAGQMGSLMKRWTSNGLPVDDFQAKLLPDTIEALQKYLPASERKSLGLTDGERSSSSGSADPRPPIASGKAPAAPAKGVPLVPAADGSYALRPGSEDADFDGLLPGARFKGPDGKIRVKP